MAKWWNARGSTCLVRTWLLRVKIPPSTPILFLGWWCNHDSIEVLQTSRKGLNPFQSTILIWDFRFWILDCKQIPNPQSQISNRHARVAQSGEAIVSKTIYVQVQILPRVLNFMCARSPIWQEAVGLNPICWEFKSLRAHSEMNAKRRAVRFSI